MYSTAQNNSRIPENLTSFVLRRKLLVIFIVFCMFLLILRAIDLQVLDTKFLQSQGSKRHISIVPVAAYRGKIIDRQGEIMAMSSPVESIWFNPQVFDRSQKDSIQSMIKLLNLPKAKVKWLKNSKSKHKFLYLKRRISPALAKKVMQLGLSGVHSEREFKRFYPAGAMAAHIIGFTDGDERGQAGIELLYEQSLKGQAGSKRVIRDGKRRIIEDVENIKAPIAGQDIVLSIDRRIQYLAYRELQRTFLKQRAKSAAMVVLDAKTGEILASVTQPGFNPNTRVNLKEALYRNRAITDVFEPGSTVKPFVVAAALDGGYIADNIVIKTRGRFRIGKNLVRDGHNYGNLNLTNVLKKSSNIAVSKIALAMPEDYFWNIYRQLGFGESANVGFPGEATGVLLDLMRWDNFSRATLSFGYGLSTSALQLARAYTVLADDGVLHSVSLLKRDSADPKSKRVFKIETARKVRKMLEQVITRGGTATRAKVNGYRVAGKTGTVKKADAGGYSKKKYFSVFAGIAPASDPKFVIVVMIDEPSRDKYYGGLVAAPVFSKVMTGILRMYGIEPDQTNKTMLKSVKK